MADTKTENLNTLGNLSDSAESLDTRGVIYNDVPPYLCVGTDCPEAVIVTSKGPLTKGRGDAAPAEPEDITVTAEGVEVPIQDVDPYAGYIFLDEPVQPSSDITVDYHYTSDPTFGFSSLNHRSLQLNQWTRPYDQRFAYRTVLNKVDGFQPKRYGHRYKAWERAYTASLNDPTTLLLNESDHRYTHRPLSRELSSESIRFEGEGTSTFLETGNPSLTVHPDGTTTLADESTDDTIEDALPALLYRDVDLSFDHTVICNARFKLDTYTKDGVFTGVGFGWSDGEHLHLLGVIELDGVQTIGLLGTTGDETEASAWNHWVASVSNDSNGDPRILTLDIDPGVSSGDTLVVDGSAVSVVSVDENSGSWDIEVDADVSGSSASVFPEIDVSSLSTYRLVRTADGTLEAADVGGSTGGFSLSVDALSDPTEPYHVLEESRVFFGSLGRRPENESTWDFARWDISPAASSQSDEAVEVRTEFDVSPDLDPNHPWTRIDDQGWSRIVDSEWLLAEQGGSFGRGRLGWGRIEPLLDENATSRMRATTRTHSFATGFPAHLVMSDGRRDVVVGFFAEDVDAGDVIEEPGDLATHRYHRGRQGEPDGLTISHSGQIAPASFITTTRSLTFSESISGVRDPGDEGWTGSLNTDVDFLDHSILLDHTSGQTRLTSDPSVSGEFHEWTTSARLEFLDWTLDATDLAAPHFGLSDGQFDVHVAFDEDAGTKRIVFVDEDGNPVLDGGSRIAFEYDWSDGWISIRLVRAADTVVLFADGDVLGSVDVTKLPSATNSDPVPLLAFQDTPTEIALDHLTVHSNYHEQGQVGILTGTDPFDPDDYEMVDVDFLGIFVDLEVIRDPAGEVEVHVDGGTTPEISVPYRELPRANADFVKTELGYVAFGALDPSTHSHVLWDRVHYDVTNGRETQRTLEYSVLNQYNVMTSGEPVYDEDPETVTIPVMDGLTRLSLVGMKAEKVLEVVDGTGSDVNWTLVDPDTLDINGDPDEVTVTFVQAEPWSMEYLDNNHPATLLNEGTPPFPLSQTGELNTSIEPRSVLNNPEDTLNDDLDFLLNDGRVVVRVSRDDSDLYECLEISTTEKGDQDDVLHPADDRMTSLEFGAWEESAPGVDDGAASSPFLETPLYTNRDTTILNQSITGYHRSDLVGPTAELSLSESEEWAGAEDEPVTSGGGGVMTDRYGSGLLNSPLATIRLTDTNDFGDVHDDSVVLKTNTNVESSQLVDYSGPVNWP